MAKVHLAGCLSLVRPVSMTDEAAVEWLNVASRELRGYPPSVIEQACSAARRNCGHHAKILPFVSEECDRIEADFAKMRVAAQVTMLPKPPPRAKMNYSEILENERWLNTAGEQQSRLRKMGLKAGALVENGGKVRYADDLR